MNTHRFLYLFWLLPGYLLFLCVHQTTVFYSLINTYEQGDSYVAEVVEYEVKQIAAQTNGYVVLEFETKDGEIHKQKLSLPVEMAGVLSRTNVIPVRYRDDAFMNIVMIPTYNTHKGLILTNLAMATVGFLMALFAAWLVHRYIQRKLTESEQKLVIQRVDNEN